MMYDLDRMYEGSGGFLLLTAENADIFARPLGRREECRLLLESLQDVLLSLQDAQLVVGRDFGLART